MDSDEDEIFREVDRMRNFPAVTEYRGLCKIAAEHCFRKGNELDGVYYLSESHAVSIRHNAEQTTNSLIRKKASEEQHQEGVEEQQLLEKPLCPKIWKEVVCFSRRYSSAKGGGLLERIKELPKEWTVVQLTAAYDIRFAVNPKRHQYSDPSCLFISRMECGSECPLIYSSSVNLVQATSCFHYQNLRPIIQDGTKSFLEELRDIIQENKNVNTNPEKFKSARQYWNLRAEHNNRMKLLLSDVEKRWLRGWKCLFLGKLRDPDKIKKLSVMLERILKSPGVPTDLPARSVAVLSQVIASYPSISRPDLQQILKDILPSPSADALRAVERALEDVCSECTNAVPPWQWERHPVILILDKQIEGIPWEVLPLFREHPFSRVPSVHFLHGLALSGNQQLQVVAQEPHVDPSEPYYVVNPDGTLPGTEKRMVKYLECRPEAWNGMRGVEPSAKEFLKAVRNNHLVLYSGHGSGSKYLQHSNNFRVAMLLMGCQSVATYRLGPKLDPWGPVLKYMVARSPNVVGMLWEVTDVECDLVTMSLIDNWLGPPVDGSTNPPANKKTKEKSNKDSHEQAVTGDSNKKLLDALVTARQAAKQFMTSAAMVSYGVPIKAIKSSKVIKILE